MPDLPILWRSYVLHVLLRLPSLRSEEARRQCSVRSSLSSMLTSLEVRDYQSLRSLTLQLGRFNVVTGPSSSGKSALVRAMGLLAFNARGTTYIRHGAASCSVGVAAEAEGLAVAITRGARGKDSYQLVRFAEGPGKKTFTKLASKVPSEVAEVLSLTDLNFAGQFDRPYLLTESAGEVARRLGELTNVTVLFGAARLANTRRLRLASQLTDAREELAFLTRDVQRFRGLKARQQAVQQAQESLRWVQEMTAQAQGIGALVDRWEQAQATLAAAPPALPDTGTLDALTARRTRLQALIGGYEQAAAHVRHAQGQMDAAEREAATAQQQFHDVLEAAGVCPTCGQAIPHYTEIR